MTKKEPHPVDIQVGLNIREGRKLRKITQEQLAQYCGVSFQQIQKYERAGNRVSASRLSDIAKLYNVPEQWFFCENLHNQTQVDNEILAFVRVFLSMGKTKRKAAMMFLKKI